jgi:hypothetical protein
LAGPSASRDRDARGRAGGRTRRQGDDRVDPRLRQTAAAAQAASGSDHPQPARLVGRRERRPSRRQRAGREQRPCSGHRRRSGAPLARPPTCTLRECRPGRHPGRTGSAPTTSSHPRARARAVPTSLRRRLVAHSAPVKARLERVLSEFKRMRKPNASVGERPRNRSTICRPCDRSRRFVYPATRPSSASWLDS